MSWLTDLYPVWLVPSCVDEVDLSDDGFFADPLPVLPSREADG